MENIPDKITSADFNRLFKNKATNTIQGSKKSGMKAILNKPASVEKSTDVGSFKTRVNIKPMSVNDAWKGERYKSDEYRAYEKELLYILPKIEIPEPPFQIYFKFGFSSDLSDWDNPIKPTQDVISKKYRFNDKLIKRAIIDIENVEKGCEYFEFEITHLIQ